MRRAIEAGQLFWQSLRGRLLLIALLVSLLVFGLLLYTAAADLAQAETLAVERALSVVRSLANDQVHLVGGAEQFLLALAQLAEVQERDEEGCSALFEGLLEHYPNYANIGVVDAGGIVWCSGLPPQGVVDVSDRAWFRNVIESERFTVSDYLIGRISRQPIMNLAYPVLDNAGEMDGAVFAGLNLNWLAANVDVTRLPPRSNLMVIDSEGMIMARYPQGGQWLGQPAPDLSELRDALREQREGTTRSMGVDGIERLYSFVPLSPLTPETIIRVGIPVDVAFAEAIQSLWRYLMLFLAIVLLVFGLLWFGSDRLFLRKVNALVSATRRLGQGDFNVQSSLATEQSELGELARSFNDTVEALRKQQEASRAAEAKLQEQASLIDLAHDAIIVRRLDGSITFWSRGAEELYGWRQDEALEQVLHELLQTTLPQSLEKLSDELLAESFWEGELLQVRRDGTHLVVLSRWAPKHEEDGNISVLEINRDITQRKQAEEELRKLTVDLQQSNVDLESFSYAVSHDLRTPLNSIDGFSEALAEDHAEALDETGQHYLRRIQANTKRMGQLIDDLLMLSKVSRKELTLERIDLRELAAEIVKELKESHPGHQPAFNCTDEAIVEGDAGLLRIALTNLLNNAWKYTSQRGEAKITFGVSEGKDGPVYYVKDNGVGFDIAYAHHLFQPFQRLHSDFVGTGVGLATVRRIIERHGGHIWAEGEPEGGSTFFFTLPSHPQFENS